MKQLLAIQRLEKG